MTINERIMDTADGWTFRMRVVYKPTADEDDHPWLWFVAPVDRDSWLIFYGSHRETEDIAVQIANEIKGHRTERMCVFAGEPWRVVETATRAVADSQSDFMHAITLETYKTIMGMTPDQVLEQRGFDEAQAIADLGGGPGPSMN